MCIRISLPGYVYPLRRTSNSPAAVGGFLIVLLAALLVPAPSADSAVVSCSGTGQTFAGGTGTSSDPYLVSNQAQLQAIGALDNPGNPGSPASYLACAFKMTGDIGLTGNWTPIADGLYSRSFTGEFDGDGHTISGLSISPVSTYYSGLFGNTNGKISNLFLTGAISDPSATNVGGLVGQANSGTLIKNVHVDVDVSGDSVLGGIVGWGPEVRIENSSSAGDVTRTGSGSFGRLGGLIGWVMGRGGYTPPYSSITDSYATGSVTGAAGTPAIGGLVGHADSNDDLRIIRSYAAGPVVGGTTTPGTSGGLLAPLSSGSFTNLTVTGSFWDKETSGKTSSADGLGTGETTASMKSYSTFSNAMWDIENGWSPSKTWGICDGSTYPFLNAQYLASPCVSPTPPDPGPTPGPGPSPEPTPNPSPTPEPSGKPKLKLTVGMPKSVRAGKKFTIRLTVSNKAKTRGESTARDVRTCLIKPSGLYLVGSDGGSTRGRKVCWSHSSLAAGKSVTYSVEARTSKTMSGSTSVSATASASNSSGTAVSTKSKRSTRVVQPKSPKPQPPTG